MDSITQAVLGATIQGAMLGRWQGRKALLYGAVLGTLPDLDVVIDYGDAVAQMTYHRGFSHSLIVLFGLTLLLTWLVRRFRPHPGYSTRRLFATLALVLLTHPLLDSFTSYGTQLFWPLMPTPTAWSSIFIIDPLYTMPLLTAVLLGLAFGLRDKMAKAPLVALALSTLYLGSTLAGKAMAEQRVEAQLARQGIQAEALFSTPTPLNSLLWRVIVLDGAYYHEALVGWFDQQPPQLSRLPRGTALAEGLADSAAHQRLAWFTDGVLRYDQIGEHLVVTDLRLGMTGTHPFRFDFAVRHNGAWQVNPQIERWPMARPDLQRLQVLWRRIWQPELRVPLTAWANELGKPLLSAARQTCATQRDDC
ncbi:metal-dependent hydrolase [Pseudomonas sp. SA3-5]|uniref:Metal-dependent hydrolase n=1 Tax=Pseudomonas aestuarii TaxID=3018340 RepID=A0ABT4XJD8_9PSED|nr:metal-dependent hydrolase [Pseudomonas aestuarii]MDA7088331.1 metal-dependent hydrolase [Pseudomonas aestuarii]